MFLDSREYVIGRGSSVEPRHFGAAFFEIAKDRFCALLVLVEASGYHLHVIKGALVEFTGADGAVDGLLRRIVLRKEHGAAVLAQKTFRVARERVTPIDVKQKEKKILLPVEFFEKGNKRFGFMHRARRPGEYNTLSVCCDLLYGSRNLVQHKARCVQLAVLKKFALALDYCFALPLGVVPKRFEVFPRVEVGETEGVCREVSLRALAASG